MFKEYKQVDLVTGEIIETYLLDSNIDKIPSSYKEAWSKETFYKPIYDFELEKWIEALTEQEISELTQDDIVIELTEVEIMQQRLDEQDSVIQEILFDILPNLEGI